MRDCNIKEDINEEIKEEIKEGIKERTNTTECARSRTLPLGVDQWQTGDISNIGHAKLSKASRPAFNGES
jgi:hypothetical protein